MKKLAAIIISFAMIVSLCACTGEAEAPTNTSPVQSTEAPSAAVTEAIPADTQTAPTAQDAEVSAEENTDEIMKIYKEVLTGAREFVVGKNVEGFEAGTSYILEDFAQECLEAAGTDWGVSYSDCQAAYAYLDCGSDGIPELSVEFIMSDEENYDSERRYIVINCLDGTPTVIGSYDYYYRTYSCINEAGIVECSGSSGAASYYAEYSYIDGAGEEHYLYSCDTEMDNSEPAISSYNLPFETGEDYYDRFFGEDVEEYYTVYTYNFSDFNAEEHEDDYDEAYKEYCKTNFFCIADEHGNDAAPSEKYASLYEENGVSIVSQQEAEDMVLKQFKDAGVTEEMRQAPYLEYRNLDVAQLNDEVIENEDGSITVGCVANLIENIKDGATIYLKPGVYNVNEWTKANELDYSGSSAFSRRYTAATPWNNHIFTYYGQLILNRINDLTIASLDPDDPAQIVTDDENDLVMSFCECSDLSLVNIIAGHDLEAKGGCTADVFEFYSCDRVSVIDCDIYGCGCYGFSAHDTHDLRVTGGRIHDCSDGMFIMNNTLQAIFTDVTFENCNTDWSSMFNFTNSNADFYSCTFRNLSDMFYINSSFVWMLDCTMDEAAESSIINSEYYGSSLNMYD